MILACGIPSEAPMRLVIEAARRLGIELVILNQRHAAQIEIEYAAHATVNGLRFDGILRLPEGEYPLTAFNGVYLRLMDYQDLPEFALKVDRSTVNVQPSTFHPLNLVTVEQNHIYHIHEALINWLEAAPLRVMNRLSAMGSNQSKPYQAQQITRAGFLTPPTLITNDPDEVRQFQRVHKRVIYKSISAVRSVVRELGRSDLGELEKIRYLPTQFQAYIAGEDVRVHVAGSSVFATRIHSQAIDYRYAGQSGVDFGLEELTIEEEIATRCRDLSRELELPLCGIDLKRTQSGEVYCFEANPSPAFSFYQEQTGQDVAAAVVQYLEYGF